MTVTVEDAENTTGLITFWEDQIPQPGTLGIICYHLYNLYTYILMIQLNQNIYPNHIVLQNLASDTSFMT